MDLSEIKKYKSNLVSKPGDALLKKDEWKKFVSFIADIEYIKISKNYETIYQELTSSKTSDEKYKIWSEWFDDFKPLTFKFTDNLKYLKNAAIANGKLSNNL